MMYSLTQALQRAAKVNPDGIASRFLDRRMTWPQTCERVARIAGALRAIGVGEGDRVAILAANSDDFFHWQFAVPWAGGVLVPVNTRLSETEIIACLDDSGSRLLIVDDHGLSIALALQGRLQTVEQVAHAGAKSSPGDCIALNDLVRDCEPAPDAGRGGTDLAALFYTGGTTGRPKGVMLTHEALIVGVLQWAVEIGVGRHDILLVVAPMFHLAGGLNALAAVVLAAGVSLVPRFEPRSLLETIESHEVTKAALVPTMIDAILACPEFDTFDLSSLQRITYGGAPISGALLRRTLAALPQVRLYQVYGQTEGGPTIAVLKPEDHLIEAGDGDRLASAGQPIAGVEVVIVDEDDNVLEAGCVGEICVRGLTISPGYWNQPDETAHAHRSGRLHTGDAGYLDRDGFLYIVDRVKDMIITGGENVYSQEVENVLYGHPAVAECAVFGIPDERWGERVHAVVRLRAGHSADGDELIAHCRSHLAPYKCIRSVDFRAEPMPLSGANKILKRELRAAYWQSRERPV